MVGNRRQGGVTTTTIGRWRTSQERRETATGRAAAATAVLEAFDGDVAALPPELARGVDPPALRRVARALLPLVLDDPAFDATVTLGSTGVGVHVHHDPEAGPTIRVVAGPPARDAGSDRPAARESSSSHVAAELADLLRRGAVRPR